jgi:hypothetical protein
MFILRAALPIALLLAPAAPSLAGQTLVLSEDFQSGVIPPAGWQNINLNGNPTSGWGPVTSIFPFTTMRAAHYDENSMLGTSDNILATPAMDLSGITEAYVHFRSETSYPQWMAHHPTSVGDGVSTIEYSLDDGASWTVAWTDTNIEFGLDQWMTADISAAAGQPSVLVGFHYYGTYAHIWYVDDIVIDDSPQEPVTIWPVNLPTTFRPAPFVEDFETTAGSVPTYMGITHVDLNWQDDTSALCNIGQQQSSFSYPPFSGGYCLEMGRATWSGLTTSYRNALVLGIDGQGASQLLLDATVVNHEDEVQPFDGIWISADGLGWREVLLEWEEYNNGLGWQDLGTLELGDLGVDTGGHFYLMFAERDDSNYFHSDGIGLDDIRVTSADVLLSTPFCFCNLISPCGNLDLSAGCQTSAGTGALLSASGTSSVSADNLVLTATALPGAQFGLFFMGPNMTLTALGDGMRCVSGGIYRFPVLTSTGAGVMEFSQVVGHSHLQFPANGMIQPGSTWNFQAWFRDNGGPCGSGSNLSHALSIDFVQ